MSKAAAFFSKLLPISVDSREKDGSPAREGATSYSRTLLKNHLIASAFAGAAFFSVMSSPDVQNALDNASKQSHVATAIAEKAATSTAAQNGLKAKTDQEITHEYAKWNSPSIELTKSGNTWATSARDVDGKCTISVADEAANASEDAKILRDLGLRHAAANCKLLDLAVNPFTFSKHLTDAHPTLNDLADAASAQGAPVTKQGLKRLYQEKQADAQALLSKAKELFAKAKTDAEFKSARSEFSKNANVLSSFRQTQAQQLADAQQQSPSNAAALQSTDTRDAIEMTSAMVLKAGQNKHSWYKFEKEHLRDKDGFELSSKTALALTIHDMPNIIKNQAKAVQTAMMKYVESPHSMGKDTNLTAAKQSIADMAQVQKNSAQYANLSNLPQASQATAMESLQYANAMQDWIAPPEQTQHALAMRER